MRCAGSEKHNRLNHAVCSCLCAELLIGSTSSAPQSLATVTGLLSLHGCGAAVHRDLAAALDAWTWVAILRNLCTTHGAHIAQVVARGQPDRLLVIAQWRPAVRTWVLELPAGILEQGETIEALAVRELKEETGAGRKTTCHVNNEPDMQGCCCRSSCCTNETAAAFMALHRICGRGQTCLPRGNN